MSFLNPEETQAEAENRWARNRRELRDTETDPARRARIAANDLSASVEKAFALHFNGGNGLTILPFTLIAGPMTFGCCLLGNPV